MGMFDSIGIKCKKCNEIYEEQSKADDCVLAWYTIEDAPFTIKAELERYGSVCCHCGHNNRFSFEPSEMCQYDVDGMTDEIASYLHNDLSLVLSDGSWKTIRNIIIEGLK